MINLPILIATWFYSGYLKPASGTWGTLAALPLCLAVTYHFGITGIILSAIILFFIGLWASYSFEKTIGEHDSSHVVIDEVSGMMIASIPLLYQFDAPMIAICFILFRILDASKIGLVGWVDKNISGALGVMCDDIIAGLLTVIIVLGGLIWMN
jgi:phosphatidylglycerophosphatase A